MDHYAVPESAIAAWERQHDLTVTVHDLSGRLAPRLGLGRMAHRHPLCRAAKAAADGDRRCIAWDKSGLQPLLARHPDGLVQACHAGLSEVVAPVRLDGRLLAVLFAGPRAAGAARLDRGGPGRSPARLAPWRPGEAQTVRECLRQLAARLTEWLRAAAAPGETVRDRATAIRAFVERHAAGPLRLRDLARSLGLSEDRASHAVVEACGARFTALVTAARLDRAEGLLRHTGLAVGEIALAAGFGSVVRFHRAFRARHGTSPRCWRGAAGA